MCFRPSAASRANGSPLNSSNWIARKAISTMLQQRLAHVRTWTYAANRPDWVDDADDFRARTRAVEDKLSDALHEALTQRFIDRRTSALLRSLKREDSIFAGISEEGEVTVEGHYVGRLDGLEFVADPRALGLEGRAVRNAALRALAPEVSRRLARIAAAGDNGVELGRDGRLRVERAAVAKLTPGAPLLKPRIELIGGERAGEGEREAARERLEFWLARKIAGDLRPLVMLETAWREGKLPADARGLAFRLLENSGALDRAHEDLDHVRADALQALKRCGVRVGRHTIFMPGLVRPRAAQTLATLWHWAHHRTPTGFFLPRPGALSMRLDRPVDWREAAAAGYRVCGPHCGSLRYYRASGRGAGAGGATRRRRAGAPDWPLRARGRRRAAGAGLSPGGA